jgi:hypothetical protein
MLVTPPSTAYRHLSVYRPLQDMEYLSEKFSSKMNLECMAIAIYVQLCVYLLHILPYKYIIHSDI